MGTNSTSKIERIMLMNKYGHERLESCSRIVGNAVVAKFVMVPVLSVV